MSKLKEYIVNESVEFSKMENNPMIYTLIIPKVLSGADLDVVKNCFLEYKSIVSNDVTSFSKAIELDRKFTELFNSPEYQVYRSTL